MKVQLKPVKEDDPIFDVITSDSFGSVVIKHPEDGRLQLVQKSQLVEVTRKITNSEAPNFMKQMLLSMTAEELTDMAEHKGDCSCNECVCCMAKEIRDEKLKEK